MKGTNVSDKTHLIKMDIIVQDIYRIWKETPSDYIYGKSILSKSRGLTRSNLKKACSLADKARKYFREEADLAVRFNMIEGKMDRRNGNVVATISEYHRCLSVGEMKEAESCLDKLMRMTSSVERSKVLLEKISGSDGSTVLSIRNDKASMVTVESVSAYSNGEKVKVEPSPPFPVYSNSSKDITIRSGPSSLSVKVRVRESSGVSELEFKGAEE